MSGFEFDESSVFGTICELNQHGALVHVRKKEDFAEARSGRLVTIELPGASGIWIIATIKNVSQNPAKRGGGVIVSLLFMGSYHWSAIEEKFVFTRSLIQTPGVADNCFILQNKNLETFLAVSRNVKGDEEYLKEQINRIKGER